MIDSRRMLWDVALSAVITAFLVGEAYASVGPAPGPMALAAVMGLALVGRRIHPLWTYLAGTAALLAMVTFYYPAGYYPIAEETVRTHVKRIFSKLGIRDRAHAIVLAYESGLVTPG